MADTLRMYRRGIWRVEYRFLSSLTQEPHFRYILSLLVWSPDDSPAFYLLYLLYPIASLYATPWVNIQGDSLPARRRIQGSLFFSYLSWRIRKNTLVKERAAVVLEVCSRAVLSFFLSSFLPCLSTCCLLPAPLSDCLPSRFLYSRKGKKLKNFLFLLGTPVISTPNMELAQWPANNSR